MIMISDLNFIAEYIFTVFSLKRSDIALMIYNLKILSKSEYEIQLWV